MNTPFIFVSCGQFTQAEKELGKKIAELVKEITGLPAFFAEEVQDLKGLNENILNALRDCVAFITVMHPRGEIVRPDGSRVVRASVWIEQEIAIATYIRHVENRDLPVRAFKHESVGREGIRDLLHLNPKPFKTEAEILGALPKLLSHWAQLTPIGIRINLKSVLKGKHDGHPIRTLVMNLVNDSNQRRVNIDWQVCVPDGALLHWNDKTYPAEDKLSHRPNYRCFRGTYAFVQPRATSDVIFSIDYCMQCDMLAAGIPGPGVVPDGKVGATIWVDGQEYTMEKTLMDLRVEAERRGEG